MPAGHDGKPIAVHVRVKNAQATTDLVTQPEKVRIGGPVDASTFGKVGMP